MKRHSRLHAIVALLGTILMVSPLAAMPSDIISNPAPTIGADPPKGIDVGVGDAKVSGQTGSFQYTYPIDVPPGRQGVAPSLALSYSSQQPLYGDIAAGWTLSIPVIERDRSHGFLGGERWKSSLAGGRELLAVNESMPAEADAAFRAQSDASYARYQQMNASVDHYWQVLQTDGSILRFGSQSLPDFGGWYPLVSQSDAYGNTVEYEWESVSDAQANVIDLRISEIRYTSHPNSQAHHARILFQYGALETCAGQPVGARHEVIDATTTRYHGASKLNEIVIETRDTPASSFAPQRSYRLIYNMSAQSCTGNHTPVRQLEQIWELAPGQEEPVLPPVTFTYGDLNRQLDTTLYVTGVSPPTQTIGWGERRTNYKTWATKKSQLLDLNADGRPDRLTATIAYDFSYEHDRCEIRWNPNADDPDGSRSNEEVISPLYV